MEKTASRFITFRLSIEMLFASHPEWKCFARDTLARHISLNIIKRKISVPHLNSIIHKRGYLIIKKRVQQVIDVNAEATFLKIYGELFSKVTRYGKFVAVAGGNLVMNIQGKKVETPLNGVLRVVRIKAGKRAIEYVNSKGEVLEHYTHKDISHCAVDCIITTDEKTGKEKTKIVYRGKEGESKGTGRVHNYVVSLFYTKKGEIDRGGESNIGQRKGVNSRLWYNIVSPNDILQMLALRLWGMILDGHPLTGAERYNIDPITHDKDDRLCAFLQTAGKNLFLNSLEVIKRNDAGDVKHKATEKNHYGREGSYQRNVQRVYQFASLSELAENVDGTFRLIGPGQGTPDIS